MDIRKVDLNLLVALDALLDECSVTRAAQRLAMSQPALSNALTRLRDLFGDPLFLRAQRGLTPTPRALELAGPVKRLLSDVQAVLQPSHFEPASAAGQISIATTDYMLTTTVIPLLEHIRTTAPNLSLSVRSLEASDIPARLARGDLDLGIMAPEFAAPDLRSRFLHSERYVGAVRKGHPLLDAPVTPESLCAYPHSLVVPAGGVPRGPVDDALAAMGMRRTVAITVPNFLILPFVLKGTDIVAVAPERLLRQMSHELALFEVPLALPEFDVIAVWHPRVHNDPRHRWLRETLAALA